ncbi:MAG: lipopolysaccharide biosynthesis protein [Methylophilus sp.]
MSLKKNVIANFIGQGWTALMGLAFLPIYIKYLGIEAYGLIGFYAVLQAWLTLLDMGITQTLNREMARYTAGRHTSKSILDLLRSLEIISIVVGLLIFLAVWQSSNLIATYWLNSSLNNITLTNALKLMGLVIAIRFIEGIYRGALLGLQKQVSVNLINMVFSTLRFGGVIGVLHFYQATVDVFFVWQAICSLLSLVVFSTLVYKQIPTSNTQPSFSVDAINQVKSFAKGIMGVTLLALLLTQIDKVLLSNLISLKEYGVYTLASSVAGGLALITAPTTQAIYPKLVEYVAQKNTEAVIKIYHQGAQLISVIVIPIALMLICFGEQFIFLWSGDMHLAQATAKILLPLVLGGMLNCIVWMPYQLQLAYGWTSFAIKLNSCALIVLIPTIYLLTTKFGAVGAAWAWALLNIGYITVGMHFMYKKLISNEKWSWYWQDFTKQLISATTIAFIAKFIILNLATTKLQLLTSLIVITLLTFVAAVLMSNKIKPLLFARLMKSKPL